MRVGGATGKCSPECMHHVCLDSAPALRGYRLCISVIHSVASGEMQIRRICAAKAKLIFSTRPFMANGFGPQEKTLNYCFLLEVKERDDISTNISLWRFIKARHGRYALSSSPKKANCLVDIPSERGDA